MSSEKKRDATEVKNAVLTDYLYLRRQAIEIKRNGQPWEALLSMKTVISGIPLSTDNYERADKLTKLIDSIELTSQKVIGDDEEMTDWNRSNFRNFVAIRYFDNILRGITKILQDQGYFEFLKDGYGLKIHEYDSDSGVEI